MSWHFSQALVEEYLAANSLDGELSALLKSMYFVPSDLCNDKTKGTYYHSQFGMMFVPLTEDRGTDLLTWFLEDSPVSRQHAARCGHHRPRSGLWKQGARIIDEVRPGFVFVENSPLLTRRGLGVVLGDLAEIGYDAEWDMLGGSDLGAWHQRKRIWILAADYRQERVQRVLAEKVSWKPRVPWCQDVRGIEDFRNRPTCTHPNRRAGDGMADRVDRLQPLEMDKFQSWQRPHGLSC